MSDEVRGSILDILGMDHAHMVALAQSVGVEMLTKMEPALVAWVQQNLPKIMQDLLGKVDLSLSQGLTDALQALLHGKTQGGGSAGLEPILLLWASQNAAPMIQSLLDTVRTSLSAPPSP